MEKIYKLYCDKIAISFGYGYYDTGKHYNKDINAYLERQVLVTRLLEEGIINTSKPHHLLGCYLPQEFMYYNFHKGKFDFIETIDTSSPIVHGILGVSYTPFGLRDKRTIKLAELFNTEVTREQRKVINFNVEQFKKINLIEV